MNETILIKIGELILKGNNRSRFEDRLMTNIKHALRHTGSYRIWKSQGTMYVEPRDEQSPILPAIEKIKKVFGITQISHAYTAPNDMNEIYKVIVEKLADSLSIPHNRVYAVGDGYNDIEMLVAAECGFVPCTGSSEALAVAGRVVRSNDEGAVAHVIEILDEFYS